MAMSAKYYIENVTKNFNVSKQTKTVDKACITLEARMRPVSLPPAIHASLTAVVPECVRLWMLRLDF